MKVKSKYMKNTKICVECGKTFFCSPSSKTVTCSPECRSKHAKKRRYGAKLSEETRQKISESAVGRDMSKLQKIATNAAKSSPKSGRFKTNVNAIDWHLISPSGKHFYFHSLNFWLRENCIEFFGCEPDSKEFKNVASGLRGTKRASMGKISPGQRPCSTYKGWQVVPTNDDYK